VIVAHPGTQHSYETALAVQESGLLQWYVTGFYYDPSGSLGRLVARLPQRLRSRLERDLWRRHKEGLDPRRVLTLPVAELVYASTRRLGLSPKVTAVARRWRSDWFEPRVARIVARKRPRALLCYNDCALRAFTSAKALGVLCVLDQTIAHAMTGWRVFREEAALDPSLAVGMPGGLQRIMDRCTAETRMADLILAGSEYVRESLISHGVDPARVAVVPYGVDTERFRPGPRTHSGKFRLLYAGQVSRRRKGIRYLLEAVKQLNLPALECVLIGHAVGAESMLAPYRDHFTHMPNVPHRQLHTYFQAADAFVYPSLHEGSAIATYEALASGLPVITTPNSGSVVRDGIEGFVVPIRDVEALKEKILLLYRDQRLREEMAHRARERAEEFTWKAYRQRLGAVLHRALAGELPVPAGSDARQDGLLSSRQADAAERRRQA
jgi:glycosyltransferase involved in cell wall biosynthesis